MSVYDPKQTSRPSAQTSESDYQSVNVRAGASYQIATLLSGERYSLSPGLTSNARYHASVFGTTPSTRNRRGEWTSLTNWSLNASSRGFPLQDCAYARKKRCSPV